MNDLRMKDYPKLRPDPHYSKPHPYSHLRAIWHLLFDPPSIGSNKLDIAHGNYWMEQQSLAHQHQVPGMVVQALVLVQVRKLKFRKAPITCSP